MWLDLVTDELNDNGSFTRQTAEEKMAEFFGEANLDKAS
jgi:hypothetical protein